MPKSSHQNDIQTFSYFKRNKYLTLSGWKRALSSSLAYTEIKIEMEQDKEPLLQPKLHENYSFRLMNRLIYC